MGVILILILASLVVATGFLVAFIWAVRSGQFEDTCTPSMRVLIDDAAPGRGGEPVIPSSEPSTHER
jgi:cbb3-type cytochrome oxidase maturation protein